MNGEPHFGNECYNFHDVVVDYSCGEGTKPKIICLAGSTRFRTEFDEISRMLTEAGHIVLAPGVWNTYGNRENVDPIGKRALDRLHRRKIDLCDEVYLINVAGYISPSTRKELEYARSRNKTIRYYHVVNEDA